MVVELLLRSSTKKTRLLISSQKSVLFFLQCADRFHRAARITFSDCSSEYKAEMAAEDTLWVDCTLVQAALFHNCGALRLANTITRCDVTTI